MVITGGRGVGEIKMESKTNKGVKERRVERERVSKEGVE